jgi:transcriptional regulator
MYTPPPNVIHDEVQIRDFVERARAAWMVTNGTDGVPLATFMPVIWRADTVFAHMAIANGHWRAIDPEHPVLLIFGGNDAYVSPSWYAAKAEHGKVVPTWNYSAVHLAGTVRVHQDPAWLLEVVTELTERHEASRRTPWRVSDAPDAYIAGQLRGIVGLEISVTKVEGKAKLSQNRSVADQLGVIDGLKQDTQPDAVAVASDMQTALAAQSSDSEPRAQV